MKKIRNFVHLQDLKNTVEKIVHYIKKNIKDAVLQILEKKCQNLFLKYYQYPD